MIWRRCLVTISAAVVLSSTGCGASEPADYVMRRVITLPYPGGIDAERLKQSYRDTVEGLKKRAADETRDADYQPQVGSYAVYPVGDARPWVVFGAVTPRKGVFYAIPYGHYASLADYRNGRIEQLKGEIDVCRMEIRWDQLPDGPFAPGRGWAGMFMSGADCKPPPADQLAMLNEWKNIAADYFIESKASDGKVSVTLIREVQRKGAKYRPFDPVAASTTIMEAGDTIAWAIPLLEDDLTASVLATQGGRLFAFFTDRFQGRDFPNLACGVDGLKWPEIAGESTGVSGMSTARQLCRDMIEQYRNRRSEEARRAYRENPNTIQSISPEREIDREKR